MTIQEILDQRTAIDTALAPFDLKCRVATELSFSNILIHYHFFPNTLKDIWWSIKYSNEKELRNIDADEFIQKLPQVNITNWGNPQDIYHITITEGTGTFQMSDGQTVTVKMKLSFYDI